MRQIGGGADGQQYLRRRAQWSRSSCRPRWLRIRSERGLQDRCCLQARAHPCPDFASFLCGRPHGLVGHAKTNTELLPARLVHRASEVLVELASTKAMAWNPVNDMGGKCVRVDCFFAHRAHLVATPAAKANLSEDDVGLVVGYAEAE